MTNPYLTLEPEELAGVWGMRAAELMPPEDDMDEQASAARDTAFMLLAGAMRVARAEIQQSSRRPDSEQDNDQREKRVRFEVLKRAASLAIPDHPDVWLLDAQANGLADLQRALDSDEGLCEVLRHLQQIAWIGGRWRTSNATRDA